MTTATETTGGAAANAGLGPESVARYLEGAPSEMDQYAFFIGNWACELRIQLAGDAEPLALRGEWRAEWRHAGRMLVDDLTVYLPSGEEVLGWMNLRTWCAETGCWEISGHRALAPCSGAVTHGHWRDGEMHLDFETTRAGEVLYNLVRFYAIADDAFEWVWQQRTDSTEEWSEFASISARRM